VQTKGKTDGGDHQAGNDKRPGAGRAITVHDSEAGDFKTMNNAGGT
jgi:hypothetical protein